MQRRILLLVTDLELGGTPTVVRELAVRLNRPPRVTVEVACLARWGPVADDLQAAGVAVTALDAGRRGVSLARALGRLIRLIRGGRDTPLPTPTPGLLSYESRERGRSGGFDTVFSFLIHANAAAASASAWCRRVRFIQSIQTTQPEPRWHWQLQRAVHLAAQRVVVPSQSVARAAAEWSGVPAGKVVVIPNAVDVGRFERSPLPPQDPRPYPVVFLGRLDPVKRVPDLLEAVRLLDGLVHLHVYGDGRDRGRVLGRVAELNLGGSVTLHGAVPGPAAALSTAGLLVLPSQAEGFGLVLIEAMAAGVPVVATDVAGIRDVVEDGETGLLVPPGAPPALAGAIRRVVEDRELRESLVTAGLRAVRERYSWEGVLPRYQELLALGREDE